MSEPVVDGNWAKWLNVAGSLASLIALGYVWHLFGPESRRGKPAGLSIAGLPAHGRIPMATVRRAMKKIGRKVRECGITPDALREGMEIEREHRDVTHGGVAKTARIAAAHLCERPDYYRRLKRFVER